MVGELIRSRWCKLGIIFGVTTDFALVPDRGVGELLTRGGRHGGLLIGGE